MRLQLTLKLSFFQILSNVVKVQIYLPLILRHMSGSSATILILLTVRPIDESHNFISYRANEMLKLCYLCLFFVVVHFYNTF